MNGISKELMDLLKKWKVEIMAEHFIDEKIDIDELKMMRKQHMTELVSSFSLGIRIRFQYEFENWRNDLNLPIMDDSVNTVLRANLVFTDFSRKNSVLNAQNNASSFEAITYSTPLKPIFLTPISKITDSQQATLAISGNSPQSVEKATAEMCPQVSLLPTSRATTESPKNSAQTVHKNKSLKTQNVQPLVALTTPQRVTRSLHGSGGFRTPSTQLFNNNDDTPTTSKRARSVTNQSDGQNQSTVGILQILEANGIAGFALTKTFNEKQSFTDKERTELINMAALYFHKNEIHLTLNESRKLVEDILRTFPGEERANWGSSKKNKIYVKYCNNKRFYVPSAPPKRSKRTNTTNTIQSSSELAFAQTSLQSMKFEIKMEDVDDAETWSAAYD